MAVRSYGVACFRRNKNNETQVLMVKRRYTYEFTEFVHHTFYKKKFNPTIFDNMTNDEKIDIMSLKFSQMWYRITLRYEEKNVSYLHKKNLFEKRFLSDGGQSLINMLQHSQTRRIPEVWELPKGRRLNARLATGGNGQQETEIETAVREFGEETLVTKNMYKLYPDIVKELTFSDGGVNYAYMYYFGIVTSNFVPTQTSFKNYGQIKEISEMKWVNMNHIREISRSNISSQAPLEKLLLPLFRLAKNITNGKKY